MYICKTLHLYWTSQRSFFFYNACGMVLDVAVLVGSSLRITFCTEFHGAQRMKPTDLDGPLTGHLPLSSGQI